MTKIPCRVFMWPTPLATCNCEVSLISHKDVTNALGFLDCRVFRLITCDVRWFYGKKTVLKTQWF